MVPSLLLKSKLKEFYRVVKLYGWLNIHGGRISVAYSIGQSSFISSITRTARPLSKLKHSYEGIYTSTTLVEVSYFLRKWAQLVVLCCLNECHYGLQWLYGTLEWWHQFAPLSARAGFYQVCNIYKRSN